MHNIRLATPTDLPRLVGIYKQAIASHIATADTIPFTIEARRGWLAAHSPDAYPIYSCEDENVLVVGYLSINPYRNRPALARTAEISYYVDYGQHNKGIGSSLTKFVLQDAARIGKKVFLAIVLEWNTPSLRLLEKFGFEEWGYLPEVANFSGSLCPHLYYGLNVVTSEA